MAEAYSMFVVGVVNIDWLQKVKAWIIPLFLANLCLKARPCTRKSFEYNGLEAFAETYENIRNMRLFMRKAPMRPLLDWNFTRMTFVRKSDERPAATWLRLDLH